MAHGTPSGFVIMLGEFAILIAVFYFLMIRPQQQQAKQHTRMLGSLAKNDEVVTSGGIHATVVAVTDKTASLRIADNVRIEVDKSSIAQIKKREKATA